jgi:predicted dehydrogenase
VDETLRIGIVGLGFGTSVHIPTFLSIDGVRVNAVCGTRIVEAQAIANRFGISAAFDSWEAMMRVAQIDAVSIVVPPRYQSDIVRAALAARKHILCEKPFGNALHEAQEMTTLAGTARCVAVVNFQFRMEPGIRALKDQVRIQTIGRPKAVNVTWVTPGHSDPSRRWSWHHDEVAGGGVISALGCHAFDYVQWICDEDIASVSARSQVLIASRLDSNGTPRNVTAEDTCVMECRMEGGCIVRIDLSRCGTGNGYHHIEIEGTLGRLTYHQESPFTPGTESVMIETAKGKSPVPFRPLQGVGDTRVPAFRELAMRFTAAIRGVPQVDLPQFVDGTRVRRIQDAAKRAAISDRPVLISEV